jgi:hypothetical protein
VPVVERHEDQIVWADEVQVFAVEHPKADKSMVALALSSARL